MDLSQPYKTMTKIEVIRIMQKVGDVGESLTTRKMDDILGTDATPSRGKVAELLVAKFASQFEDYISLDGNNEVYFSVLRDHLRGKKFEDQYAIIIGQIDKLDVDEDIHGAAEEFDLDIGDIRDYLKDIIQ